jgi:small subunit ribosomal protein S18
VVTGNASIRPKKPRWSGSRYPQKKRVCFFCRDKVTSIDYKDATKFGRYISDRAKIEPRRRTGTCARHQRMLARAIKRARHLALLPFVPEHVRISGVVTGVVASVPSAPVAEPESLVAERPVRSKPVVAQEAPSEPTSSEAAPGNAS